MRKLSVWMLVIALVLGIGFAAGATELDCLSLRSGNMPLEQDMTVTLTVPQYARLCVNDMSVSWDEPGDWLKPGSLLKPPTVAFSGGANCPITLTIASAGFEGPNNDSRANDWIQYLFLLSPLFHTLATETAPEVEAVDVDALGLDWVTPGTSRSFSCGQGKWGGTVTARGQWKDDFWHDWTNYTAGKYEDIITFTVAAQTTL